MNSTWLPTIFGLFWFLLPCTGCFVTVVLFMAICLPKCRSSLQDLTLTKRYIDSFEGCQAQSGERKMYTVSIFTLKGSICGPNHIWKPPEVILKQLWELLCWVLHVGHQSRMSCSDYILPHRTKCVHTSNFLYCIWVSLKTQADTWILGVFNVFNLPAFFFFTLSASGQFLMPWQHVCNHF